MARLIACIAVGMTLRLAARLHAPAGHSGETRPAGAALPTEKFMESMVQLARPGPSRCGALSAGTGHLGVTRGPLANRARLSQWTSLGVQLISTPLSGSETGCLAASARTAYGQSDAGTATQPRQRPAGAGPGRAGRVAAVKNFGPHSVTVYLSIISMSMLQTVLTSRSDGNYTEYTGTNTMIGTVSFEVRPCEL